MLKIGLTGGLGSGKSTVANLFAAKGIPIIDADQISHELVKPGTHLLNEIANHFGATILTADGRLDRAQVRERIFNHLEEKAWLEELLHPALKTALLTATHQVKGPYCIIDIPLLVETGPYPWLDRICVVDCPEALQIERVQTRSGLTPDEIQSVLKTQAPRAVRLAAADDLIDNSGSLESLGGKINQLHEFYLKLC